MKPSHDDLDGACQRAEEHGVTCDCWRALERLMIAREQVAAVAEEVGWPL